MTGPLRVLLVEDSETDAKLILLELRRTGRIVESERVETPEAMRCALAKGPWDVVLSDWSMPHFSATAALAVLKESDATVPFLIVSGSIGEEAAVQAMRSGARDYVLKDRLSRLSPAVDRELRECRARESHRAREAALQSSEARFSLLSEAGIIAIIIGDLDGNILEANNAFLDMLGFTRADLLAGAIRWRDVTPPEWQAITDRGVVDLRTRGVVDAYEKEYFRKDGSRVPILIGLAALPDGGNIAFMVDLRAQKRAEAALRSSENQLRQSQKMEAVGRLAAGIAHDFNNLLSVILSYSSMIVADLPAGDPIRADVEQIGFAGQRAAALTRQLLTFSRQEVVEPKVLDVNDLLVDMGAMLQRTIGEDVDLAALRAPDLGRVRIDPGQLEQVILNLAVNARDAMPNGGKLTIETKNVLLDERFAKDHLGITAGAYVMLAVSDTGVGMDAATQARIFEPFFTTKGVGQGTGLGLSTVFGIAHQCGGSVWVYSEPGMGTTFKVYIPRVDLEVDTTTQVRPDPLTLSGSETILLVEDDAQLRAVALEILRKQGYCVIEASGAAEAIASSDGGVPIDLLITDVVMPRMSGPELARSLLRARPSLKVLFMSGYTDDALFRHGALDAGMAYLQKPLTPDALLRKVRAALDAT